MTDLQTVLHRLAPGVTLRLLHYGKGDCNKRRKVAVVNARRKEVAFSGDDIPNQMVSWLDLHPQRSKVVLTATGFVVNDLTGAKLVEYAWDEPVPECDMLLVDSKTGQVVGGL